MVIFPQSMLRVALRSTREFLQDLKKTGTQTNFLSRMQTRQELYDLLDYDPSADRWPKT